MKIFIHLDSVQAISVFLELMMEAPVVSFSFHGFAFLEHLNLYSM